MAGGKDSQPLAIFISQSNMITVVEAPVEEINNRLFHGEYVLIDARSATEYSENRILGSISCPRPMSLYDLGRISLDWVQTYCVSENHKHLFCRNGNNLKVLIGGNTLEDEWVWRLCELFQEASPDIKEMDPLNVRFLDMPKLFRISPVLWSPVTCEDWSNSRPPSIIFDFLRLGVSSDLSNPRIFGPEGYLHPTHIINASSSVTKPRQFEMNGIQHLDVRMSETMSPSVIARVAIVFEFIEAARRTRDGLVFLHCETGISRSVTLALYYIMRRRNCPLLAAYEYTQSQRPEIFPARVYMLMLIETEKSLRGGVSSVAEGDVGKIGGLKDDYRVRTPTAGQGQSLICEGAGGSQCLVM